MKPFLIVFLSIISLNVKATECVDRIFKEEKINLYLCQNYSNYNETTTLLFKVRTKVLNGYIQNKIKTGQLQDKKFEIQIYDAMLTSQHLELTQGKSGYYIHLSGFPTIKELIIFVDYFSKKDWRPFIANSDKIGFEESVSNQIDTFFKDNIFSKQLIISKNAVTVWTQGSLHLEYIGDELKYFAGETPLRIEPTSSLPIKIQNRFILFQSDSIFVLEREVITKQIKIERPIFEDYDIYQYREWVNICEGGCENWVYSYSYRRNKFYKNKK